MQNMFILFEKKPVIAEKIGAPNLIVPPTQSAVLQIHCPTNSIRTPPNINVLIMPFIE